MPPEDVLVGLAAEIDAGALAAAQVHDDGFAWPEQIGSIENSPHLPLCLGNAAPCQEQLPDGSTRFIVPIENVLHEPYAFLLIQRAVALTAFESGIVQGFVKLLKTACRCSTTARPIPSGASVLIYWIQRRIGAHCSWSCAPREAGRSKMVMPCAAACT